MQRAREKRTGNGLVAWIAATLMLVGAAVPWLRFPWSMVFPTYDFLLVHFSQFMPAADIVGILFAAALFAVPPGERSFRETLRAAGALLFVANILLLGVGGLRRSLWIAVLKHNVCGYVERHDVRSSLEREIELQGGPVSYDAWHGENNEPAVAIKDVLQTLDPNYAFLTDRDADGLFLKLDWGGGHAMPVGVVIAPPDLALTWPGQVKWAEGVYAYGF